MATNIVLKRSSSSGAVPGTSDLALGEIALNTYDGKMYMKKTVSGSSSIVELTGGVALSSSAFDLINYKFVATSNQTSFSGSDANSVTLAYASGTIQVFLNGILLDPTDYTATNGTAVVLDTGANSGDILYISRFAGVNPFDDFKYVASSNQTSFSGDDANSNSLIYTVGNLAVYLNGVLLDPTDYTATTGTSVVLASGASSGDILHIHEFNQTGLTEVHADTTPTLGGDLDLHTYDLVTTDNRNIDIIPHGTGDVNLSTDTVKIGASGEDVIVTTNGTGDITLSTNAGTNSGTVKILDGANQNIEITPNGSGKINLDGLLWPNADGSANQFIQTDGSGNLSFVDVLDTSEEIQDTVGAMFSSNTETGITATYQDSDGTIDLALVSRTIHGVAYDGSANIDLTEEIQDTVGAMFSSNTETNITATYQDSDGTIDLVVPNTLSNVTELGTLTHLDVDNLNLNGNTLTSASSDFIIDASHNISLDADGGYINLKDGGTSFGELRNSSTDFLIKSTVADKDILLKGNDGGAEITALQLDMSNAGTAIFNNGISEDGTAKSYTWRAVGNSGSSGHRWVKIARIYGNQSSRVSIDLVGRAGYGDGNKPSYARVMGQLNNDNNFDFTVQKTGSPFEEIGQVDVSTTETDIYVKITSFAELSAHGVISSGSITATTGNSGASQGVGSEPANYVAFTEQTIVVDDGSGNISVSGEIAAATLDISGNVDVDGTLEADAITVNGTALSSVIAGTTLTQAAQTNITSVGTLTALTVDNLNLNGHTITSDTHLSLDIVGDLLIDVDGAEVKLSDAGDQFGTISVVNGNLSVSGSDADHAGLIMATHAILPGEAGAEASANVIDLGANGNEFKTLYLDTSIVASNALSIATGTDLTLDAAGDIILDVDGTDIILKDGGTTWGLLANNSSDFVIRSAISNQDLLLQGNDGGSTITALTLDMSDAGKATFNSSVAVTTHARGTLTTDDDGSFDMNASNNFKCTPSGNFTLTFTNRSAQSGNILLINSGGHTVSAHANTKVDANILGTISTAGTYLLAYFSDGSNVYMTNSAVYT